MALGSDRTARVAPPLQALESRIEQIAQEIGSEALAISLFDYETGLAWSRQGDRWFHSASTIKVAVLFALFGAVDAGRFTWTPASTSATGF